ncbi:ty3-gypsy retrotransposon protein [Cucumis melo var. makuwa]|uniref:Ty3-gypsy retrotransposon protein n=1 Tax=Cucumis melo var. makuwa TaxID=1194695 RepID=A0A5D3CUV9_CUCMM|nr:ty3-gypsy retrotransposon protein [Cucumis melo var. makuwa]TYK15275.1 ty3-gypsy retrotransposon protein [Cucumis melo var. makuwa]
MITNSIRVQYGEPPETSFMYSKSYTKKIDNLRMSFGYQPLKFQQFDGKGNPKQHIAHFVETGMQDQKETKFSGKKKFLNRFYNTRRTVSMMELTNTKQQKGEPIIDYINRLRALSLDCKDRLTELSSVEMCTQDIRGAKDFPVPEVRKDKKETKDTEKIVKSTVKESTIKEIQEKVHPFPDSNIADMLEQLLEKQLIQMLECRRPEQVGKVDDPNYCKYHRVITYPVEKCFVLKELILRLAREKKIELDLEKEVTPEDSQGKERLVEEDDEGWIVVTH